MTADSSDTADMANAKTEADKFASGVTSEATFVTQCRLYSMMKKISMLMQMRH